MKVILLQDVPTLGRAGEVREVKDGYAAHYLLPRGLAARATTGNLQSLQQTIRVSQVRDARTLEQTAALKSRLEALVVEVTAKAGEGGRLFGSVTAQDIAEAITGKGVEVSKRQVELQDPIKAAGFYRIPVRIHPNVSALVEVNVVEALRPEDFYRDVHRTIYTAMLELFERGEPVDLVTVTNKLGGMGKLEDVGGATYLASLPNTVPTAANAEFYAGIVLEKAMLRALIGAGTHIASLGYEGADDVAVLIDQAEKPVYGISARRNIQDFQTIKEILKASFEKIDKRYQEKGTVTGVATGFTDFDMLTSGLQAADMVIVAARPSVGKCLSADSEILLEDGRLATIEEIYRRRQGRLLTLA